MSTAPTPSVPGNLRRALSRRRALWLVSATVWAVALAATAHASDDLETQLWGNLTFGWIRGDRVYLELDTEPKVLVSGEPGWHNVDVTGLVEYYPNAWIDVTGETTLGSTLQTDGLRTTELTFRAGVRLHLVENVRSQLNDPLKGIRETLKLERTPLGRYWIATLVRLEERNFWYSDDTEPQSGVRARIRLEFKVPLNHESLGDDRTWYLMADGEGYVTLGDEVDERYASKLRGRIGIGYRINVHHRVDVLYILDRTQNTIDDTPTSTSQAIDFRYRMVF